MPYVLEAIEGEGDRDGYGGRPYLRDGAWPVCSHAHVVQGDMSHGPCKRLGKPLTHFMRFDVRDEWKTPWPAGSHFSLFLCVGCADAVLPPDGAPPWRLPERFWERSGLEPGKNQANHGWWHATLEPPGAPLVRAPEADPLVAARAMKIAEGRRGGPLVGTRLPEGKSPFSCGCGAPMDLVTGIGADVSFPTLPGAPQQYGTYSSKKYRVFLGNETTLLACTRGCDPRAVIPFH